MKKRGFTIIETLIAVAILMISVTGPLVVANKSLTAALYAKDQMEAMLLAQEGMELVRNYKDNVGFTGTFGTGSNDGKMLARCGMTGSVPDMCGISLSNNSGGFAWGICDGANSNSSNSSYADKCRLYIATGSSGDILGYQNKASDPGTGRTIFYRSFYVTTSGAGTGMKVTVVVSWNEGKIPNEVDLVSFMTDTVL